MNAAVMLAWLGCLKAPRRYHTDAVDPGLCDGGRVGVERDFEAM
jgi:hypothetical protein